MEDVGCRMFGFQRKLVRGQQHRSGKEMAEDLESAHLKESEEAGGEGREHVSCFSVVACSRPEQVRRKNCIICINMHVSA